MFKIYIFLESMEKMHTTAKSNGSNENSLSIDRSLFFELANKSVLITGANGLVGFSLAKLLLDWNERHSLGIKVYAFCRNEKKATVKFSAYSTRDDFEVVVQEDLLSPVNLSVSVDYIIHAASPSHPAAFSQSPADVFDVIVGGAKALLLYAKEAKARLLFVSTGEVYGENPSRMNEMSEEYFGSVNSMSPRSCYPEGKRAAETLCACFGKQYGIDVVVVRLCYVYGSSITEENSRADAQFLRNAIAREDIVMKSEGRQLRSYCYVEDAVEGLLYAMVFGKNGEAYNVSNPTSVATVREYAEELAGIAGVAIDFQLPSEKELKGYSTASRSVLDSTKLLNLGWKPRYSLRTGLARTYELAIAEKLRDSDM